MTNIAYKKADSLFAQLTERNQLWKVSRIGIHAVIILQNKKRAKKLLYTTACDSIKFYSLKFFTEQHIDKT